MPKATATHLQIEYEACGPESGKPILLIPGLGMQLVRYSQAFVDELTQRGFLVIRMDNRDMGLSEGCESEGIPNHRKILAARLVGLRASVPYTLDDMAADCVGVLDHLGIERAHIAGCSMGGMIAQLVAIHHAPRTLSLTSIMSSTGHPMLPRPTPEAAAVLTQRRANPETHREAYLNEAVEIARVLGSPGYPDDDAVSRARAAADLDRAFRPSGFARQYAAILAAPHRRRALADVRVPATVIHGTDDPLVPIAAGRDTAQSLPDCELLEIDGMGHNIPDALNAAIADALAKVAERAARAAA